MERIQPIRTYSDAWLDRHRQTHARVPVFGTHRHPYLLETTRPLATRIAASIVPLPARRQRRSWPRVPALSG